MEQLFYNSDEVAQMLPSNTNSTFDNKYMSAEQTYSYYNEFMWNRRYAECISVEETIERMKVEV